MVLSFNCSTLFAVVVVVYFSFVIQQLYYVLNPLSGVEIKGELVSPLWKEGDIYDIVGYLSTTSKFQECTLTDLKRSQRIIFQKENLIHTANQSLLSLDLRLLTDNSSLLVHQREEQLHARGESAGLVGVTNVHVPTKFFEYIQNNKTSIFFNFLLFKKHSDDVKTGLKVDTLITKRHLTAGDVLFGNVKMIKYDTIPRYFRHRYLLSDFGLVKQSEIAEKRQRLPKDTVISYWKPEVSVKMVSDFSEYPVHHVPFEIGRNMILKTIPVQMTSKASSNKPIQHQQRFFKPALFVDEIGLTSDKYIHLNETVTSLPVRISIGPMSTQRWHLISKIEETLKVQKSQLGIELSDSDLDDFRRMISDTSITLLTVTLVASILHLLFEYLAFSSDIQFWKENKSLIGLSIRALFTDFISQGIIFLFLIENNTSLLITIPAFIALLIQMWKIHRATGLRVRRKGLLLSFEFSRLNVNPSEEEQQPSETKPKEETVATADSTTSETSSANEPNNEARQELEAKLTQASLEADRFATKYLSLLFAPLILGYVIYTLCYQQYASWYSWAISSLTTCVYTFGFILMCPQLYINHQLKSVSYLPWQYLIYKFLNTFVDDLFAFIIKMPTMHRLSVFRDDIVFFIYLYQRWIYRVDTNRPTEK